MIGRCTYSNTFFDNTENFSRCALRHLLNNLTEQMKTTEKVD